MGVLWLKEFLLTLVVECPLVVALLRRMEPGLARLLVLIAFANLATHPAVWFLFPRLPFDRPFTLALSELWAFAVEWLFYRLVIRQISTLRACLVSLVANGASLAVGLAAYRWCSGWML